ncbi:hypothetical protein H4F99_10835 [Lysobacter sp. SG-8]|uniref:Uncharacterized protein n=1 Tax=Marilutibacter penaei TaxID=2759900 RepID=A0A7W3U4T1_9GAMM|nr:hypothetical protein [Lysobacter penaei]MBB1088984.1 hypothetical protein [Lysobacter penaei]
MSQNIANAHPDDATWAQVDTALQALEDALGPLLVPLSNDQRRRLPKMGEASEAFCRTAVEAAAQNAGLMPRDFDVEEMRRDLVAHDAYNVRLVRLNRLTEQVRDTEIALGSDVMAASLEAYAFLKINGKAEGLHGLKRSLGRRFDGGGRRSDDPTPLPGPQPG